MTRERIQKLLVLFGLPESFSEQQLRQAYRDLVQVWHPDRHAQNDRLRRKAEEKLKEINDGEKALSSLLGNGRFDLRNLDPDRIESPFATGPRPPRSVARSETVEPDPVGGKSRPSGFRFVLVCLLAIGALSFVARAIMLHTGGSAKPVAVDAPIKKSERLDATGGFKGFALGMSRDAARFIQAPDEESADETGTFALLTYTKAPATQLSDYRLDRLELRFVADQLYRIEIFFSANQDKVYQSFTIAFGDSNESHTWTRNGKPLRARYWLGEKALCTILAPSASPQSTGWDRVVLSDVALAAKAAAAEKDLMAAVLAPTGFKELAFGMSAQDVQALFTARLKVANEPGLGETSVVVGNLADRQLTRIGLWPLDEIRLHFFKDSLYRIDLAFSKSQDDLYRAFIERFPGATENSTWTRSQKELNARQWSDSQFGAAILALPTPNAQWDRIILFQTEMMKARKEYQDDAPARAAKEI